jgi:heat shock protein 5
MTKDNHFLGAFDLTGLPPGPRGTVQIQVTFELDQNNMLKVTAEDKSSNNKESITINAQEARLSEEERLQAIRSSEEWAAADEKAKAAVNAKNNLEMVIYTAKRELGKDEVKERFSNDERKELKKAVREAGEWLDANPDEDAEAFEEKRKEITQILAPVLQGTGQAAGLSGAGADSAEDDFDDDDDIGGL